MAEAKKMFFGGVLTKDEIDFLKCQYTNYVGCLEYFVKKIRPELEKTQKARQKIRKMQEKEQEMNLETKEILKQFDIFYDEFSCPHSKDTHIENPISEENGADWEETHIENPANEENGVDWNNMKEQFENFLKEIKKKE